MISSLKLFGPPDYPGVLMALPKMKSRFTRLLFNCLLLCEAGSPDIVFPKYRTVVFVHGCFWHGHKGCKNYTIPKTNTDFWVQKVDRNQQRDQEVWRQLEAKDWSVIIVWECELEKKRFDETIDRVKKEIIENGRLHEQRRQERRLLREQRLMERREQKARQEALLSEIRKT